MKGRRLAGGAALALLLVTTALAQDAPVQGIAPWLPARTLFCLEAPEPRFLLEVLRQGNAPKPIAELTKAAVAMPRPEWLSELDSWLTAEKLPELQKLNAAAFAITDLDARNQPRAVWVCRFPKGAGGAFPAALTRKLKEAGWKDYREVAGVKLQAPRDWSAPVGDEPATPPAALFAGLPEGVVYGSPEAVIEVVGRAAGQGIGASLAQDARYQALRADNPERPKLLLFTRLDQLLDSGLAAQPWSDLLKPNEAADATAELRVDGLQLLLSGNLSLPGARQATPLGAVPTAPLTPTLLRHLPVATRKVVVVRAEAGGPVEEVAQALDRVGAGCRFTSTNLGPLVARLRQMPGLKADADLFPRLKQMALAERTSANGPALVVLLEATHADARDWLLNTGLPQAAQNLWDLPAPLAWEAGTTPNTRSADLGAGRRLHLRADGLVLTLALDEKLLDTAPARGGGQSLADVPALAFFFDHPERAPGLLLALRISPGPAAAGPAPAAVGAPAAGAPAAGAPAAGAPAAGDKFGVAELDATLPGEPGGVGLPAVAIGVLPPLGSWIGQQEWLAIGLRREPERVRVTLAPLRWPTCLTSTLGYFAGGTGPVAAVPGGDLPPGAKLGVQPLRPGRKSAVLQNVEVKRPGNEKKEDPPPGH